MSARLGPEWRALVEALRGAARETSDSAVLDERVALAQVWWDVARAADALLAAEVGLQNLQSGNSAISASMPEQSASLPASPAPADPELEVLVQPLADAKLDGLVQAFAMEQHRARSAPRGSSEERDAADISNTIKALIEEHVQRREAAAREAGIAEARKTFSDEYDDALASGCDSNGARDCAVESVDNLTRSQPHD